MPGGTSAAVVNTVQAMAVDQVTAEVVTALETRGVDMILLKGPAIARLLYPRGGRAYVDTDLLVSPDDFEVARNVLVARGFVLISSGISTHALAYARPDPATGRSFTVDLHQRLPHFRRSAGEAWSVLRAETVEMTIAGVTVRALSVPGRAMHVALHAAQHGEPKRQPLEDLRRAIAMVGFVDWQRASALAHALGAEDLFGAGLRLSPQGAPLANRLGLPDRVPLALRLKANGRMHPGARELQRLADARTRGQRLLVLREGLLPRADVMRSLTPLARRGRAGLILAHVTRLLSIARRAVATLACLRSAHRRR